MSKNSKMSDNSGGGHFRGSIDVLSGGDPCQPNSVAGLGKGTSDIRFLWPEMFRIAQELNVPWIVNENVSGSIANGVLDLKIDDLESVGYTCQAYCIPAESVGALHQRERVWLIAYNADLYRGNKIAREVRQSESEKYSLEGQQYKIYKPWESVNLWVDRPDADIKRCEQLDLTQESKAFTQGVSRYFGFGSYPHGHISGDILKSGIIRMLNGLPEGMDYAGRNQRIKALGNSIVPQVAFEIFKAIDEFCITIL